MTCNVSSTMSGAFVALTAVTLLAVPTACTRGEQTADEGEETLGLGRIPSQVMATLTARFPGAEIQQWTREEEDGVVLYDFEFLQQGQKLEADIREDGSIHNWEREIPADELTEAVVAAVESEYPGFTHREIMAITAVVEGVETLEGYEIVFEAADGTAIEVMVTPEGVIAERDTVESG
jgi:hypothetical protein